MADQGMKDLVAMLLYPRVGQPVRSPSGKTGHIEAIQDGVATIRWDDKEVDVVKVSALTHPS